MRDAATVPHDAVPLLDISSDDVFLPEKRQLSDLDTSSFQLRQHMFVQEIRKGRGDVTASPRKNLPDLLGSLNSSFESRLSPVKLSPVSPVSPLSPVSPVSTVSPVSPVSLVTPLSPVSQVSPEYPATPVSPLILEARSISPYSPERNRSSPSYGGASKRPVSCALSPIGNELYLISIHKGNFMLVQDILK